VYEGMCMSGYERMCMSGQVTIVYRYSSRGVCVRVCVCARVLASVRLRASVCIHQCVYVVVELTCVSCSMGFSFPNQLTGLELVFLSYPTLLYCVLVSQSTGLNKIWLSFCRFL